MSVRRGAPTTESYSIGSGVVRQYAKPLHSRESISMSSRESMSARMVERRRAISKVGSTGNRVEYLDTVKAMKIGIVRDDLAHAVLSHECDGMRVVENATGEMRHANDELIEDLGVPVSRFQ